MHEEKIALVRRQIEALAAAVASRNIRHVWVVACGGSLATLDPFRYILTAETDKVSAAAVNAAEFAAELPKGLGEDCLVVLNSQSGTTAETVRAAQLAKERGALTAAYTTAPESPLEQAVDFPIYYYDDPVNPIRRCLLYWMCGKEQSVCRLWKRLWRIWRKCAGVRRLVLSRKLWNLPRITARNPSSIPFPPV